MVFEGYEKFVEYFELCCDRDIQEWETLSLKRAAEKIKKSIPLLQANAGIRSRKDFYQVFSSVARERCLNGSQLVFLHNAGGSGSHWLQGMLLKREIAQACGEVKFVAPIRHIISQLHSVDRLIALNIIHLLHLPEINLNSLYKPLVNSSHMAGWRASDLYDGNKLNILLLRDPVDIVLSRTFRKQSYKSYIAPDESDDEYFLRNVDFVKKFYQAARSRHYDFIVKYEDIVADEEMLVQQLSILLDSSIESFSPVTRALIPRGFDNKYHGDRHKGIEVENKARALLMEESKLFSATTSGLQQRFH